MWTKTEHADYKHKTKYSRYDHTVSHRLKFLSSVDAVTSGQSHLVFDYFQPLP